MQPVKPAYVVYERVPGSINEMIHVLAIGTTEQSAMSIAREFSHGRVTSNSRFEAVDNNETGKLYLRPCAKTLASYCTKFGYNVVVEEFQGLLRPKKEMNLKLFCDTVQNLHGYLGWLLDESQKNNYEFSETISKKTVEKFMETTINNFIELEERKLI